MKRSPSSSRELILRPRDALACSASVLSYFTSRPKGCGHWRPVPASEKPPKQPRELLISCAAARLLESSRRDTRYFAWSFELLHIDSTSFQVFQGRSFRPNLVKNP